MACRLIWRFRLDVRHSRPVNSKGSLCSSARPMAFQASQMMEGEAGPIPCASSRQAQDAERAGAASNLVEQSCMSLKLLQSSRVVESRPEKAAQGSASVICAEIGAQDRQQNPQDISTTNHHRSITKNPDFQRPAREALPTLFRIFSCLPTFCTTNRRKPRLEPPESSKWHSIVV